MERQKIANFEVRKRTGMDQLEAIIRRKTTTTANSPKGLGKHRNDFGGSEESSRRQNSAEKPFSD